MGPLTQGQISVSNNHVYCALKSGTVKDLTASGYVHPSTKQCNYSVDIVDNLTTASSTSALSAKQGQELNTRLAALENAIDPSRMQILTSFTVRPSNIEISTTAYGANNTYVAGPSSGYSLNNISVVYCVIEYNLSYSCTFFNRRDDAAFYITFGYRAGSMYIISHNYNDWGGELKRSTGTFTQVLYVRNGNYYKNQNGSNLVSGIPGVYATYESSNNGSNVYGVVKSGTVTGTIYGR